MNSKQLQNLMVGAAVATGLVGAGVALWLKKKEPESIGKRIKRASSKINKSRLISGVTAGLVGLTTALLTTPQSGRAMMGLLSDRLREMGHEFASEAEEIIELEPVKKPRRRPVAVTHKHAPEGVAHKHVAVAHKKTPVKKQSVVKSAVRKPRQKSAVGHH